MYAARFIQERREIGLAAVNSGFAYRAINKLSCRHSSPEEV